MASMYVSSGQMRYLRACMLCSIVQTESKFNRDGCPNCETHLQLAGHSDAVRDCTSQVFEGLITLMDPATSWVARWQRLDKYVPGVYATKVAGTLPEDLVASLEADGASYYPRDGSGVEQEEV